MELKQYTVILWRWKWVLVICTLLAAGSAFTVSRLTTPIFQASTTVLVNQPLNSQPSDYSEILASERLALTYTQMMSKRPVLSEAISRLGLDIDADVLASAVDVQLIPDTQLIELKVENPNPLLAATLANSIVQVFAEQNEARQAGRFVASKASYLAQLEKMDEQIRANEIAIATLTGPDTDIPTAELIRLQTEFAQNQTSYTNLLQSYEEIRFAEARSVSNIIQVEPAEPPQGAIRPRSLLNTLLSGAVGGFVALGVVFLIEYLDETVKSVADIARFTDVPVIGLLAHSKKLSDAGAGEKRILFQSDSPLAESFRLIRTNIELAGNQGTPRSILVASPEPGDGKTTLASQLAISMATGGKKVVLVDANLRHPRLHEYFGINQSPGLSEMLIDDLVPQVVAQEALHWRLKVITSGRPVESPGELMSSIEVLKSLTRLREQADVAIFDGSPSVVSESFVLASRIESVLIVLRYGQTREAAAAQMIEQLKRSQGNILGVVLNRVPYRTATSALGGLAYGYGQQYGSTGSGVQEAELRRGGAWYSGADLKTQELCLKKERLPPSLTLETYYSTIAGPMFRTARRLSF